MSFRVCLLAALASVISISQSFAAVLTVDSFGQLTGAMGVDVGGTLYDVTFRDESCATIFTGCDDASDFDFITQSAAELAAQALLDQVFLDGPLGNFDSDPSLTFGCAVSSCSALVPFALLNQVDIHRAGASNFAAAITDTVFTSVTFNGIDLQLNNNAVWADFSPSAVSEVPLPAAFPLFLVGLAGLHFVKRRRKARI